MSARESAAYATRKVPALTPATTLRAVRKGLEGDEYLVITL